MPDDSNFPGLWSARDQASRSAREMYPGQKGMDDQQDAARHMLAAGYLSRSYSPKAAALLGELNELPGPIEALRRLFGKYTPNYGYEMDAHNNEVGSRLAAKAKDLKDFERLVNLEVENAHAIPLEDKAMVLPDERERLRYMDKYAAGGIVDSVEGGYNPARVQALAQQLRAECFPD